MTCWIDDPLAPSAHVVAARPGTADVTGAPAAGLAAAGTASRPSTRAPPAATVSGLAGRRARRETGVLRGARTASPFISLLAPMGGYLHQHRNTTGPRALAAAGAALSLGAMRAKHWPWNGPASMMIRPREYPQVERRAGDPGDP